MPACRGGQLLERKKVKQNIKTSYDLGSRQVNSVGYYLHLQAFHSGGKYQIQNQYLRPQSLLPGTKMNKQHVAVSIKMNSPNAINARLQSSFFT